MTRRRRAPRAAALLAAVVCAAASPGCNGDAEAEVCDPAAYSVRDDPRIAPLFGRCARSDFYDRNLADVVPILIEKLARGQREPLKRAKEELAAMGEAAIPELRRFVDLHFAEPQGFAYLQNALDVLKLSEAPGARPILLRCLEHPGDAVRLAAVQGLGNRHGKPEDFDRLEQHLAIEIKEQKHVVALALHGVDPARAEDLYLGWIRTGERTGLWKFIAIPLSRSRRAATRAACSELFADVALDVRAYVAAPAAAAGDAEALAFLEAELGEHTAEARQRRTNATRAASEAGLRDLLATTFRSDPSPQIRAVAAEGLNAPDELDDATRDLLRGGLDDLSSIVRGACLSMLVARGDEVACERALAQLGEGTLQLQEAMTALARRLPSDAELAERTYRRLLERDELEAFLPLNERAGTLKSIGQVPTPAAAEFLRALALEHDGELLEGLPVHRWAMIQAANTGDPGRGWLADQLADEEDPLRRLDLLWAISAARTDATRERLLALVEEPGVSPEEVLFGAARLCQLGPTAEVAGRLKRLANRMEEPEARVALQCLLWKWY